MIAVSNQLMGMYAWGHGGGFWIIIPILWSVLWIGMLGLVLFAVYRYWGGPRSSTRTARAILADRFARGEIDQDEYRRRMAGLS